MNKYNISFTMYQIVDGKISGRNHFSNCKATIEGETFDDAVIKFKEQKLKEGWFADFIVEGNMFEVTFYDLD